MELLKPKQFDLSICIPTFNRIFFLRKTLERVAPLFLNQDNIQLVISDNGSTDGTREFLLAALGSWENTKLVLNKKNLGFTSNVANLFSLADGKYSIILGDDDYLVLENIMPFLNSCNNVDADIAVSNRYLMDQSDKIYGIELVCNRKGFSTFRKKEGFGEYLENCTSSSGLFASFSNVIFKTDIVKSHRIPFYSTIDNMFPHTMQWMWSFVCFSRMTLLFSDAAIAVARFGNGRNDDGRSFDENSPAQNSSGEVRHFSDLLSISDFLYSFDKNIGRMFGNCIVKTYLGMEKVSKLRVGSETSGNLEQFNFLENQIKRYGNPPLG